MMKTAVGLGEILWDMLPEGKALGGAPANFAYHISKLGYEGCAVSAVGRDALGREIIRLLSSKGLSAMLQDTDYPTGTVDVELSGEGIPRYNIRRDVAWDHIAMTGPMHDLAARTDAVCFGSLAQRCDESRTTIRDFLRRVPAAAWKIFDINLRQDYYSADLIRESLALCNVLKINDEEVAVVASQFGIAGDLREVCQGLLRRHGLQILILTCGTRGSRIFTAEGESFVPTPRIEVADTVGAGDSFTAGFIASLLDGLPVPEAHDFAVTLSAFVCTQQGAMPDYSRETLRAFRQGL